MVDRILKKSSKKDFHIKIQITKVKKNNGSTNSLFHNPFNFWVDQYYYYNGYYRKSFWRKIFFRCNFLRVLKFYRLFGVFGPFESFWFGSTWALGGAEPRMLMGTAEACQVKRLGHLFCKTCDFRVELFNGNWFKSRAQGQNADF